MKKKNKQYNQHRTKKKNETVKGEGKGKENNKLKLSGVTGVQLKSFA